MGKLVACSSCRQVFYDDLMRIPFTSRWRKTCAYCGARTELVQPSSQELAAYQTRQGRLVTFWLLGEIFFFVVVVAVWWLWLR